MSRITYRPTLPGYTPVSAEKSPNRSVAARLKSRTTRQHTAATVQTAPYRWVEPFTWVDGNLYGESDLKQQFVTNFLEIPHVFGVLQEDVVDTESADDPLYSPVLTGMTIPLGANEVWYFVQMSRYSSAGVSEFLRFGWYTPLGASVQGVGVSLDANENPEAKRISLNATLPTKLEWEAGAIEHQSGVQRLDSMEFYVFTTTAGNLECGFTTFTDNIAVTVYAGTCIMGMRLSP